MTDVAVCVPRRADGGPRDALWEFCRPFWEHLGWPVFEGESPDGPFNRSAAINDAVRRAGPRDVYVIADTDVVIDPGRAIAGVEAAVETGRLVMPFTTYMALTEAFTAKILAERYDGSWKPGVHLRMTNHVSSVLAVSSELWEQSGGFDDRFVGWGWDDLAFHHACSKFGRPVRLTGSVWHLWHPTAPENTKGGADYRCTPSYVAGCELARRYRHTQDLPAMLAEPRTPDQVVAVVLTTGTRDTLEQTIESFDRQVSGPIGRKVIVVDGKAKPTFDGWETVNVRGGGFGPATAAGIRVAIGSGQPWVFWCEDDFTFNEPVDLTELQAEMDAHPDLVQLSLLRQAWYPHELDAGGIVEANPDAFEQRGRHLRQRDYWTTNPHLTRRLFLAGNEWPKGKWSEAAFTKQILKDPDVAFGVWGDGTPSVTHIGETKAGSGY